MYNEYLQKNGREYTLVFLSLEKDGAHYKNTGA